VNFLIQLLLQNKFRFTFRKSYFFQLHILCTMFWSCVNWGSWWNGMTPGTPSMKTDLYFLFFFPFPARGRSDSGRGFPSSSRGTRPFGSSVSSSSSSHLNFVVNKKLKTHFKFELNRFSYVRTVLFGSKLHFICLTMSCTT
jgi:hypothetical protein